MLATNQKVIYDSIAKQDALTIQISELQMQVNKLKEQYSLSLKQADIQE